MDNNNDETLLDNTEANDTIAPLPQKLQLPKVGKRQLRIKQEFDTHTYIFNLSELHGQLDTVVDKFKDLDMDKMIGFVGAEGKYKYCLIIIASLLSVVMSMTLYSSSFLYADPSFQCKDDEKSGQHSCHESEWCELYSNKPNADISGTIDWKYHSWVQDYNLICERREIRSICKQIIMFTAAFIGLIASVASDSIGRVFVFKWVTVIVLCQAQFGVWIDSIWVKTLSLAIFVGEEAVLCVLFTYIINESCMTESNLRSRAIAFYFAIFASGGVFLSLMTYVVKDPNVQLLIIIVLSVIVFIPVPLMIYEPPKQLKMRGKVSDLFQTLKKIADRNGKDYNTAAVQHFAEISEVDLEVSKCSLKTKMTINERCQLLGKQFQAIFGADNIKKLIGYFMVSAVVYTIYSGVTYNAGEIGLPSIQIDVMFLCGVEIVCYIVSIAIIGQTPRKLGTVISFVIILIGAGLLVMTKFVWGKSEYRSVIETAIVCTFIKGGLSFVYVIIYTYGAELFPSTIRGTAVGLALTSARIAALSCEFIIALCKDYDINGIAGCSVTALLSLPFLLWLPETLNKQLHQFYVML